MGDAMARRHQVGVIGRNLVMGAKSVAMMQPPMEKTGHRGQADMRMRADIHPLPRHEFSRSNLIKKDEWANHLSLGRRQRAARQHVEGINPRPHEAVTITGWAPMQDTAPSPC